MSDAAVRTSTKPGRTDGSGTSVIDTSPVFMFCRTCFIYGHFGVRDKGSAFDRLEFRLEAEGRVNAELRTKRRPSCRGRAPNKTSKPARLSSIFISLVNSLDFGGFPV